MQCSICLYQDRTDMNLYFQSGICAGCKNSKIAKKLNWEERKDQLRNMFAHGTLTANPNNLEAKEFSKFLKVLKMLN